MKKLMTFAIIFICALFSYNVNAVNDLPEVPDSPQIINDDDYDDPWSYERNYVGMLTWYGDEGMALIYEPRFSMDITFWVRQFPSLATVWQEGNIVYVKVNKAEWIQWGAENPLTFGIFYNSYTYRGSITLYIQN